MGALQPLVGVVGVSLAWALAGTQWWRARSSSAGISVLSWAAFLATNVTWCVYAVGTSSPFLLVNTVGSGSLNAALLWRIDPRRWRTYAAVGAYGVAAAVVGALLGRPALAVVCFATAFSVRWPQLAHAVRAPDLSGVSLASWSLALVNNSVWVAVGVARHDLWFAAANVALALSTAALVVVVALRRRVLAPVGATEH